MRAGSKRGGDMGGDGGGAERWTSTTVLLRFGGAASMRDFELLLEPVDKWIR